METVTGMDERPGLGSPAARLAVQFSDEPGRPLQQLLAEFSEEQAVNEQRLRVAEALVEHEDQLQEWLRADPAHARRLLTDPGDALREVFPDLDPVALPLTGRHLVEQLLGSARMVDARIVVVSPPEVLAAQLLRDVAEHAGNDQDGYAELFQDVEGTVTEVAGDRFGPDVIARVVDGIRRALSVSPPVGTPAVSAAIPSPLLAFLAGDPDTQARLAGAVVEEVGKRDLR